VLNINSTVTVIISTLLLFCFPYSTCFVLFYNVSCSVITCFYFYIFLFSLSFLSLKVCILAVIFMITDIMYHKLPTQEHISQSFTRRRETVQNLLAEEKIC